MEEEFNILCCPLTPMLDRIGEGGFKIPSKRINATSLSLSMSRSKYEDLWIAMGYKDEESMEVTGLI